MPAETGRRAATSKGSAVIPNPISPRGRQVPRDPADQSLACMPLVERKAAFSCRKLCPHPHLGFCRRAPSPVTATTVQWGLGLSVTRLRQAALTHRNLMLAGRKALTTVFDLLESLVLSYHGIWALARWGGSISAGLNFEPPPDGGVSGVCGGNGWRLPH
jgi:hypothetical protein